MSDCAGSVRLRGNSDNGILVSCGLGASKSGLCLDPIVGAEHNIEQTDYWAARPEKSDLSRPLLDLDRC